MRRRPDVHVKLRPGAPTAGDVLDAEIVLRSATATPFDGVTVRLRSVETIPLGKSALVHTHLALEQRFDGGELSPGDHALRARFALPGALVPSYTGELTMGVGTSIAHTLEVHVKIPWWLDRHAAFVVPVRARADARTGTPRVYATHPGGPREGELAVELSLDSDVVAPGEDLSGAVALWNVASHRVRSLRLDLVAVEIARKGAPFGMPKAREGARFTIQLSDHAPAEGAPTPFRVTLPRRAPPSFGAAFFHVAWRVDAVADVALGRDVTVSAPLYVVASAEAIAPSLPAPSPAIGRERRAKVWASVAAESALTLDADRERLHGDFARVALDVALEREGDGARLVAHLTHPSLGLGLDAHSRAWTEVLHLGEIDLGNEAFARRVAVRGEREAAIRTLFDAELCGALAAFEEVHLDDEGAALASDAGGSDAAALGAFVAAAIHAARALDAAIARVLGAGPSEGPYR